MSKTEEKQTETKDILEQSMAQTIAERDVAIENLSKAIDMIEKLKKELDAAKALIEEDTKAGLIKDIAPLTTLEKSVLSGMTVDELLAMKKTISVVQVPAFKSGTPVYSEKKMDARTRLQNKFDEAEARRRGGNK